MNYLEHSILEKKDSFRKRRNIIRNFFLFLFFLLFLFLGYKLFLIQKKITPVVEVKGSGLIYPSHIQDTVFQKIKNKNFFPLSPKNISRDLLNSFPLIQTIIIRKYLLPSHKYIVYLKEKNTWAKLYNNKNIFIVTDEGDVVRLENLNLSFISSKLIPIYLTGDLQLDSSLLIQLKEVFKLLHDDFHISLSKFLINSNMELEIYPHDKFRIKAGKIDEDLIKRVSKVKAVIDAINKKSYLIQYLDLTLEEGAIFKKYTKEKEGMVY